MKFLLLAWIYYPKSWFRGKELQEPYIHSSLVKTMFLVDIRCAIDNIKISSPIRIIFAYHSMYLHVCFVLFCLVFNINRGLKPPLKPLFLVIYHID